MSIVTMATRITEENLPIVQACLPTGFLNVPPRTAFEGYLVINETRPQTDYRGEPIEDKVDIVNTWYDYGDFNSKYEALEPASDIVGFFEVRLNKDF